MATPILLFGIGATKSGTSWLYNYLRSHPECHLRSIKELHFFDSLENGSKNWHLKELDRKCAELENALSAGRPANAAWNAAQLADTRIYARILKKHDEAGYLSYLADGRTDESVISDITPCYSMLSEQCLSHMASMTEDVRFVFLMRDPVDRLWSHVRMIAKRRSKTGNDIDKRAGWIFNRTLEGGEDHILERGDYRGTLTRLQPFYCEGPVQDPPVLDYLRFNGPKNIDISLEVGIIPEGNEETTVCHSNFKYMYWNINQQLAHQTVNGCLVRAGDMYGSGTISAPAEDGYGSMMELTWRGQNPLTMKDGSTRKFIEDGDTVVIRGWCERNGIRVGFGEVSSKVLPAI